MSLKLWCWTRCSSLISTDVQNLVTLMVFVIWNAAARGYALSYLSSSAGRIRYLMGTPGIVALDLDPTLKGLFQRIVQHLESIPKAQGENVSAITCDLSVRWTISTYFQVRWCNYIFLSQIINTHYIVNSLMFPYVSHLACLQILVVVWSQHN